MTATFANLPAILKNLHKPELIVEDAMRATRNSICHKPANSMYKYLTGLSSKLGKRYCLRSHQSTEWSPPLRSR